MDYAAFRESSENARESRCDTEKQNQSLNTWFNIWSETPGGSGTLRIKDPVCLGIEM